MGRYAPALIAVAILGVVGIAAAYGGDDGGNSAPPAEAIEASIDEVTTSTTEFDPLSTESVVSLPEVEIDEVETTDKPKDRIRRTLVKGLAGKDVKRVQQRLIELHFDPGEPDGIFGDKTRAAVWAYEKLVLGVKPEDAKGKVTPEMWLGMQDDIVIKPKRTRTTRRHLEVYLPSQVAILFERGKVRLITHISSGTGEAWEEVVTIDPGEEGNENGTEPIQQLVKGVSITPGGVYKFYRRYVDEATGGWREGRLGRMYKPVYFNYGIAVHGSKNVPLYPASHGCIRIPMHIAEYFPDLVKNGDRVYVFDGKKSPEYYGAKHPVWDKVIDITPTTDKPTTTAKKDADETSTTKKTTTTVAPTTTKKSTTTTTTTTTEPDEGGSGG
jgi:hypothetical protein